MTTEISRTDALFWLWSAGWARTDAEDIIDSIPNGLLTFDRLRDVQNARRVNDH
jgi:hypothetical protein